MANNYGAKLTLTCSVKNVGLRGMATGQASPSESSAIGKAVRKQGSGHGSAVLDELLIALVQLRTLDQMVHQ